MNLITPCKSKGLVVFICGPSGSGKTTLSKITTLTFPTYIEDASRNPHLPKIHSDDFDAMENQLWFLREQRDFMRRSGGAEVIVFDQHPIAICDIYPRYFQKELSFCESNLQSLLAEYNTFMTELQLTRNTLTLALVTRTSTLVDRISARNSGSELTREQIRDINGLFQSTPVNGPVISISTEDNSPEHQATILHQQISRFEKTPR